MDTYSILREFADSWWLIVMTLFFLGVSLYTLRPGTRERHREIAMTPLRNDRLPEPAPDHRGARTSDTPEPNGENRT
ncbi:MAG: cbb3-type cytochrome c oxidase subunit 3 [Pseudomonadota bacterium]